MEAGARNMTSDEGSTQQVTRTCPRGLRLDTCAWGAGSVADVMGLGSCTAIDCGISRSDREAGGICFRHFPIPEVRSSYHKAMVWLIS